MVSLKILLLCFLVIITSSAEEQVVSTKPFVTAYWGRSVELPCQIPRPPLAVFWFQHNFTAAPDEDARIVVQNFNGEEIARAGPRFEITSNFSLTIHDVSVQDETTYSCRVAWLDDQVTNYTQLRVVGLADELNPITVENCRKNGSDWCMYYIDPSESTIQLKCQVSGVRPAVNLTWIDALTGEVIPSGKTNKTVDSETGLITVYRVTQESKQLISGSDVGQDRMCQADGEAVGGTSNLTVLLREELREQKRKKIRDYKPGKFSRSERSDDVQLPRQVKLSVIGPTGAGNSSFIRSLNYAFSGTFTDTIEVGGEMVPGGVTRNTIPHYLTGNIIVEDNRGLHDLSSERVSDLKSLRSHPVLVLTHRDKAKFRGRKDRIIDEAKAVGALDEKLFFVENFTKRLDDNDPELEVRTLEFLDVFLKLLDFADDNLVRHANNEKENGMQHNPRL
ncbi:uncharacterized protein [Diadema antillarum]|uniref:uncharacterized protein n=1 Tax=Diadema antillarum TaxID=105358 RepID=UPI003A882354